MFYIFKKKTNILSLINQIHVQMIIKTKVNKKIKLDEGFIKLTYCLTFS